MGGGYVFNGSEDGCDFELGGLFSFMGFWHFELVLKFDGVFSAGGGGGLTSRLSLMNPSVPGVIGDCLGFSVTGFILSWGLCLSLVPDVEGLSVSGRSFASLGSRVYFTISQGRWGMTGPECSSCVPGFEPGAEPIGSRMGV